jgi:hypothetical protein
MKKNIYKQYEEELKKFRLTLKGNGKVYKSLKALGVFLKFFVKFIEKIEIKEKKQLKDKKNLQKVATREKRFSTLAKIEGKGAHKRALSEHGAAKKDSEWEQKVDNKFAKIRAKKAKIAKKKIDG